LTAETETPPRAFFAELGLIFGEKVRAVEVAAVLEATSGTTRKVGSYDR